MEWITLLIGLVAGLAAGFIIARITAPKGSDQPAERELQVMKQLEEARQDIASKDREIISLNREVAARMADWKNMQEKLDQQKLEMEQIREKFSLEFKNLANEILEEKTRKFTEQNKTGLEELLKPFGEKIRDFEKKVNDAYTNEAKERFSLKEEVKRLAELNQQVSKEASNLTRALKAEVKTQGNWGEMILESILEKSGLVKDREYFVQASFTDAEGRRLQPDVVVKYPGDRNVIVDSKVSLVAYERYMSAGNDDERQTAAREHLQSIRKHIQELSQKNYQNLYELKSLDFIMMFMPVEPAYLLAIQSDSELWTYAYERRILLISPTNLIASLKMIESMWRQEYQNKNALEIARQGGELLDKLHGFLDDLLELGKKMDAAQKAYDESMKKLYSGRGNLIRKAETIRELGAKSTKNMPGWFQDKAAADESELPLNS